ncbi:metal ABC transporter permease [Erysipelothrix rhusiopathiae]|uniref:metal ABC transporter permease n=1 Tax=Erysipelothrix rhusiopathiae TaxID=1648 RepID=UPI000E00B3DE|nr:metal ABC transporter permease [Erysipelothrix rhusiopathiae]MDE8256686.1 metal ABC transporter permease [Erysipelothrix rhusiopathiae]MDE8257767.1 metal ABC transporter permease [Erysipelothrix rhusiopathiae]MDE8339601.1 metal ABC transporter permease [Erysipelothrix rhusiopathiae]MDE8341816.1 metal ABC transporter permease [Erysipelothrix rhusiopathiae]MDE9423624.1 metal ABC transporter permease [Erysipelothrix rhusiopathiae]
MFKYEFMRTAFLVGGLLAVIIPLIGVVVVFKRMSMIGDALSHVSLSGITIGLILGFNPIVGAIALSLVAALSIEFIQKKFGKYQELAIAIIMSFGIGLSGVLLGFVKNPANFNSFLFGSIVAIGDSDNLLAILLSLVVIGVSIRYYREFFYLAFDEKSAFLSGIDTNRISLIFTILTAITVSIASRIVGALIVSSLMVIPTACAMQVSKSYRSTMLYAIVFSLTFVWLGLALSYTLNLAPGGTIVLLGVGVLVLLIIIKAVLKRG